MTVRFFLNGEKCIQMITETLREQVMHGCVSVHDPRWPQKTAEAIVVAILSDPDDMVQP